MILRGVTALLVVPALGAGLAFAGQALWKAPEEAREIENPLAASESTVAEGKKIFERNCAPCHGTSGKGDGPAAKAMGRKLPNFTDPVLWEETDGELFWKITKGRAPMPRFEEALTDTQRWQVVHYIRSLAPKKREESYAKR